LEKALQDVEPTKAKEIVLALDALFGDIEGPAMIAKQAAENPLPQFRPIIESNTFLTAEKIYEAREYLQAKASEYDS